MGSGTQPEADVTVCLQLAHSKQGLQHGDSNARLQLSRSLFRKNEFSHPFVTQGKEVQCRVYFVVNRSEFLIPSLTNTSCMDRLPLSTGIEPYKATYAHWVAIYFYCSLTGNNTPVPSFSLLTDKYKNEDCAPGELFNSIVFQLLLGVTDTRTRLNVFKGFEVLTPVLVNTASGM
jgi:hypothetical protein